MIRLGWVESGEQGNRFGWRAASAGGNWAHRAARGQRAALLRSGRADDTTTRAMPTELDDIAARVIARLEREGADGICARVREHEAWIGVRDRWAVRVVATGERFVLATIDPETAAWSSREVDSVAALDVAFAELARSVAEALAQLSVHRLRAGRRYRVAHDFVDISGNPFVAGEVLVFEALAHLPYADGYTLRFVGRGMWLVGDSDLYARFGWLVVADD